jgi:hypothetical protein
VAELDYSAEWWLRDEVAQYLKVSPATVTHYARSWKTPSHPMPKPTYVGRTPRWRPAEIVQWHLTRPGRGRRAKVPTA